jgi:membrane protein
MLAAMTIRSMAGGGLRARAHRFFELMKNVGDRAGDHDVDIVAAGLSFYALLGLFPSLLALVSIYGLIADPQEVQRALTALAQTLPPQARDLVISGLAAFVKRSSSELTLSIVFSIVAVLWSSSSGMGVLVRRLNVAHDAQKQRNFFARRALALGFTFAAVVAVAFVVPALTALPKILSALRAEMLTVFVPPLALALAAFVALLLLYRYAPYDNRLSFREVMPGAAAASLAWMVVTSGYSFYLRYFARLSSTYGALEGVIVLELWFYFSTLVLLYAAELNVVLAGRRLARPQVPVSDASSTSPPPSAAFHHKSP